MNLRRLSRIAIVGLVALASSSRADAKLEGPQWAEAEKGFRALFATTVSEVADSKTWDNDADRKKFMAEQVDKKIDAAKVFFAETDPRAFRIVAEGLVLEVGHVSKAAEKLGKDLNRLAELLNKTLPELGTDGQNEMFDLQRTVSDLETSKANEQKVIQAMVSIATQSPEGFRKEILKAMRAHADWPMRAVAARIAASAPTEEASKGALVDLLEKEKDPSVRLAGVEGLEKAAGTSWHALLAGRCEDPDWGVQIVAARIAGEREVGKAIPNLIKALGKATPRVGRGDRGGAAQADRPEHRGRRAAVGQVVGGQPLQVRRGRSSAPARGLGAEQVGHRVLRPEDQVRQGALHHRHQRLDAGREEGEGDDRQGPGHVRPARSRTSRRRDSRARRSRSRSWS